MEEEWKIYKIYKYNRYEHKKGDILYLSNYGRAKINSDYLTPSFHFNYLEYKEIGWIHRAVAELFIPNPENKPCVEHIDCNRLNNRADNLKWATSIENNNNPITRERRSKSMTGKVHTPEHNKKISDSISGINHPWYGKNLPQEMKDKISKSHKKIPKEQHGFYGKKHTEETKEKIGKYHLGKEPANKGKKYVTGYIWITNGFEEKQVLKDDFTEEKYNGYKRGRIKRKRTNK